MYQRIGMFCRIQDSRVTRKYQPNIGCRLISRSYFGASVCFATSIVRRFDLIQCFSAALFSRAYFGLPLVCILDSTFGWLFIGIAICMQYSVISPIAGSFHQKIC